MIHPMVGGALAAAATHGRNTIFGSVVGLVLGVGLLVAGGAIAVVNRRRATQGRPPIASGSRTPTMFGRRGGQRRLHPPTMAIGGVLLTAISAAALMLRLR